MKITPANLSTFGRPADKRVKGKSKGRRPVRNDTVSYSPGRRCLESKVVTIPTSSLSRVTDRNIAYSRFRCSVVGYVPHSSRRGIQVRRFLDDGHDRKTVPTENPITINVPP